MQSSISAVEEFISNTAKLFFPLKDSSLARHKKRSIVRNNLIISTLCLMPCTLLSLPAQASTEDIAKPTAATPTVSPALTTNAATPATNTATTPAVSPAPTTNVATPATNTATPAVGTAPTTNTVTPAANTATPAVGTAPTTNAATPAVKEAIVSRPANEIANLIATKQHPYLSQSDFTHRVADLDALYQASGYQPIWLSNDSKTVKNVAEVIKLLEDAPNQGLNPADYDTQMLQQKLTALKPPLDLHSKDLALYDTAISLSLLRFMNDVHYGRINPRGLYSNIQLRTEKTLDLPALIKTNQDSVSSLLSLVEPKLPQYQKLKQALASYRPTGKAQPFKLDFKSAIRPNDPLLQSAELQQFLAASGYLPADKVDNSVSTYTDTIMGGVKKFQQQHGIKANGVINKATAAAFNAPLTHTQRITQIELAMERLRWLPEITEGPAVMVNIPAFQLFAFDDINQDSPTKTMRVVVGKAAKNQTPILTADMQFVDFQPYWNVPFKIARDEILPRLLENPGYLSGHNMEVISRSGRKLGEYGDFSAQIRQGSIGIRQRPGSGNALGKVKFIFPNKSDVYLHDTPSVSLFSRSRRDLSHGCVRVAEPQHLAEFVLKNEGDWNVDAIKKAMKGGKNRRVTLKNTIPVFFLYNTAFPNEKNELAFYTDIYHHDAKLLEALKKPRKDLSDQDLFAPKEVIPPTDEPNNNPIEASRGDTVTSASVKQQIPVVETSTKPVAIEPVAAANVKQITTTEEKSASTLSP